MRIHHFHERMRGSWSKASSSYDGGLSDSTEFDAGYLARLSGEPQCLGATPDWADADAGCCSSQPYPYKRTA
jgi:hypothetical protein